MTIPEHRPPVFVGSRGRIHHGPQGYKSLCRLWSVAAIVAAASFAINNASAATFNIEALGPFPGRVGSGLSIALDPAGNPHLAYSRDIDTNGSFRHAYKAGGIWNYKTIVDRAAGYSSLAFYGSALFGSYQDVPDADMRFATYNGSTWTTELVSSLFPVEGLYSSLAFDQSGGPHIAYHEGSGADNAIHAFGSGGWIAEVADGFDPGLEGRYSSIALSNQDTIFISHIGIGAGGALRIRLSERSASPWETVDVDPALIGRGATAIAVSSIGQPSIAFVADIFGGLAGVLYLARRLTPTTWSIQPVDTLGDFTDLALKLDSFGQPHIAYRKGSALMHAFLHPIDGWKRETIVAPALGITGELDLAIGPSNQLHIGYAERIQVATGQITPVKHAQGTFGSWTIETVEGLEDEGQFIALTTTSSGAPVVAFYDATHRDVQVARRVAYNDWEDDDVEETGDVGRAVATRPSTVAPNTADVVYFNATDGTVVQTSGSYDAWNQTIIAAGVGVPSLSYADSSGWGRVAYYDSLAGDVFLARLGPSGTSVVAVDQGGDVGRSCDIAVTSDGVTHIIYYDATVGRLRHARSTPSGWSFTTIANGANVGRHCALGAQGLQLKAAYYDAAAGDLRWAIWNGASWATGLIDATGDVGNGCAVALDNLGIMNVSYYDATNMDLKFARVGNGGGVGDVGTVDAIGDWGKVSAIAIDPTTQLAEIVYYDATNGRMRYAQQLPQPTGVADARATRGWLRVTPNPILSGGEVRITCALLSPAIGDVAVFDVSGRLVGMIEGARLGADETPAVIKVPVDVSGVFFVRATLQSGAREVVRAVALR